MTKKLAIINDLSGFGRCSLTAAISVTSAMGVQACPLPTAILSAQTGFPSYKCFDFTEQMPMIHKEWKNLNVNFDGIYTGFVSNEMQIDHILDFVSTFYKEPTFLLVDPVMGDDGCTYDMFTDTLKEKMIQLTELADIITPNLTELCLLTHTNYQELILEKDPNLLLQNIYHIARTYCKTGPSSIVVTGIHYFKEDGIEYIGNSYISENDYYHTCSPTLGGSYSGTGDLFASCIASGITKGLTVRESMDLAHLFLKKSIKDSVTNHVPCVDGVNFEKHLHLLL